MIVGVPGGPGFSAGYLQEAIHQFPFGRSVYMFDPLACGTAACPEGHVKTFAELSDGLARVLNSHAQNGVVHVLPHSWGVTLLLSALRKLPGLRARGVIISPLPTTWGGFLEARTVLMGTLSEEALSILANPSGPVFNDHELKTFLRHYVSPTSKPEIPGLRFNYAIYNQVLQSAENYDVAAALPQIAGCKVITGEYDFTPMSLLSDYVNAKLDLAVIPNAGHFPQNEQPAEFLAHAEPLLSAHVCS